MALCRSNGSIRVPEPVRQSPGPRVYGRLGAATTSQFGGVEAAFLVWQGACAATNTVAAVDDLQRDTGDSSVAKRRTGGLACVG